jgi:potassium-transporting ATPase potassium-binding subunit
LDPRHLADPGVAFDAGGMSPLLSFNTAISFITGTNWQVYTGETQASYLTQMAGLVVAQFTAAGVGLAVALAVVRGIAGRARTIGNFWVDLTRSLVRVFVPLSLLSALVMVSQTPASTRAPGPPSTPPGRRSSPLLGVIVIVGGLIYFPMLILGPIGERIIG